MRVPPLLRLPGAPEQRPDGLAGDAKRPRHRGLIGLNAMAVPAFIILCLRARETQYDDTG